MKNSLMKISITLSILSLISLQSCSSVSSSGNLTQVGILQFCTHDGLNLCRTGFIAGMEESGLKEGRDVSYSIQNPEGEASVENSMAINLATNSALTVGIATPSALALKTAIEDAQNNVPEVFCAVTDPVAAGLVNSFTDHGNIVGTSDAGPTQENIALFKRFSGIEKIGIIYNMGEPNSIVQYNQTVKACKDLGLELVNGGVSQSIDIESELRGMIANGIKGLFVPVDNTIAAAMASIKSIIEENKVIAVCGDASEIKNGGSLGYATDYYSLGIETGKLAAQVLKGTDIKTLSCTCSKVYNLYVNDGYFTRTAISLPQDLSPLGDGKIIRE
jgi:putative ABC transport system substrate-binding protein